MEAKSLLVLTVNGMFFFQEKLSRIVISFSALVKIIITIIIIILNFNNDIKV